MKESQHGCPAHISPRQGYRAIARVVKGHRFSLFNRGAKLRRRFEAFYRWDTSFPLGHPLAKLSSGTVRYKLRAYARLHGLYACATFWSTVTTVRFDARTDRSVRKRAWSIYTCSSAVSFLIHTGLHTPCAGTWQL